MSDETLLMRDVILVSSTYLIILIYQEENIP